MNEFIVIYGNTVIYLNGQGDITSTCIMDNVIFANFVDYRFSIDHSHVEYCGEHYNVIAYVDSRYILVNKSEWIAIRSYEITLDSNGWIDSYQFNESVLDCYITRDVALIYEGTIYDSIGDTYSINNLKFNYCAYGDNLTYVENKTIKNISGTETIENIIFEVDDHYISDTMNMYRKSYYNFDNTLSNLKLI